jgi:replicative DNA helicase
VENMENNEMDSNDGIVSVNINDKRLAWEFESLEEKMLSTAVFRKVFFLTICNHVKKEDFSNEVPKRVYGLLKAFYQKKGFFPSKEILISVVRKLEKNQKLQEECLVLVNNIFAEDYVSEKEKDYVVENVDNWIKRNKTKKALIEGIDLMQKNKFDEILDKMKSVVKFSSKINTGKEIQDNIESRYLKLTDAKNQIPTFLPTLNVYLEGGFHRKELFIFMAGSGIGKTTLLINQAIHSLRLGNKVVYVTLELSEDQIKYRMDKCAMGWDNKELYEKWRELDERYAEMIRIGGGKLKVLESSAGSFTNVDLQRYLEQCKTQEDFTPDIICFDYLEKMGVAGSSPHMKEYDRQGAISDNLRNIAAEWNLAMVTATQANRKVYEIDDETKGVSEEMTIGESLKKLQISDGFFIILQNKTEKENDNCRLRIMKNRHGETTQEMGMKSYFDRMRIEESVMGA